MHSHLLPSMRATVSRRNSLPGLPLTVGLAFFSRQMNIRASKITFCVTCVVDSIVATHLRNPTDGVASLHSGESEEAGGGEGSVSIRSIVEASSNQKRQVT